MKKYLFILIGGLILLVAFVFSLRPVPILPEKECLVLTGTVTDIFEGGEKDVVLKLRGEGKILYVNRGLERGLDLKQLRTKLIGSEIVIKISGLPNPS